MQTIIILAAIFIATLFLFLTIKNNSKNMSPELERLTASVQHLVTVDESLVALVGSLAQTIRDNANDPVALNALADSLDAEATNVAAAVTANTPAA